MHNNVQLFQYLNVLWAKRKKTIVNKSVVYVHSVNFAASSAKETIVNVRSQPKKPQSSFPYAEQMFKSVFHSLPFKLRARLPRLLAEIRISSERDIMSS